MSNKKRNKKYRPKLPSRVPWWDRATPMTQSHRESIETGVRLSMAAVSSGSGTVEDVAKVLAQIKVAWHFLPRIEGGLQYKQELEDGYNAGARIGNRIHEGKKQQLNADLIEFGRALDLSIAVTDQFEKFEVLDVISQNLEEYGRDMDDFNKQEVTAWINSRLKQRSRAPRTTRG